MIGGTRSRVDETSSAAVARSRFQQLADEADEARSRGEIGDDQWFRRTAAIFDAAYPAGDSPRAQSGFGGDEVRWEIARRPIARPIDRDGTFLDIGCANGYLMECVVRWTHHHIEPYGLELAPAVAALARQQRPRWASRIFLGNALTWGPPMRFDFVRTELRYVPEQRHKVFLERLLRDVVAPGGRLIVCGYGSPRSQQPAHPVRWLARQHGFEPDLEFEQEAPEGGGPIIEVAVLRARKETRATTLERRATTLSNSGLPMGLPPKPPPRGDEDPAQPSSVERIGKHERQCSRPPHRELGDCRGDQSDDR